MKLSSKFRTGDWVEVRSKEEILATLDPQGRLEGMPFMPQMFQYCGRRLQVYRRAHKTCDTVFPIRSRWMPNAVHLDTRCDGAAYGGCQARCLLFWKDAWLRPVSGPDAPRVAPATPARPGVAGCTEQDVDAGTLAPGPQDPANPAYVCQATQVPYATTELKWWDPRQYLEDWTSGNMSLWGLIKGGTFSGYYHLSQAGIGLGRGMRWFYNHCHWLWGGTTFPWARGPIPIGGPTPAAEPLNLQPGEWVRVKSHQEILKTLNYARQNRGLYFDAEMVPYCGKTYRVLARVHSILDEKTGKMMRFKNHAVILEKVYCQSKYSFCRMFCPRSIYSYWREIWLERVPAPAGEGQPDAAPHALAAPCGTRETSIVTSNS